MSPWTHPATVEGRCPPPCGPDTEQWNRDRLCAALAPPPKGKESGGVRIGQAGGGRARGGERPMGSAACGGRGGSREGQRLGAIGQQAPPAADSNTTRRHTNPSPPPPLLVTRPNNCPALFGTQTFAPPPPPPGRPTPGVVKQDKSSGGSSALKSVLESANPRMDSECASGCPWSMARANSPVSGTADPRSSQTGQVIRGLR